jgi:trehalose 6-phosphate phosphatase
VVGNHGLEGLGNNRDSLKQAIVFCKDWKEKLSQADFGSGVEVEDKTYSLAIHYRRSRNKKQVKEQIKNAIASLHPAPQLIPGKSVINLLPQGTPHKGAAILELMKRAEARYVFYIGDDDTDEDVFGLLDAKIMSVRVGEKRSSHARFYIKRQSEINHLLRLLIHYHRPTRGRK